MKKKFYLTFVNIEEGEYTVSINNLSKKFYIDGKYKVTLEYSDGMKASLSYTLGCFNDVKSRKRAIAKVKKEIIIEL